MARKVKLGLVGCGPRGTGIATLFRSHRDCEVTSVMDVYRGPAQKAAEKLGVPAERIYLDFERMLRDAPVDAFVFACDPTVQVELACRAMEKGKHACTEVPAAFSMDECWKLVKTVEKTGCKYMLMEQTRYGGIFQTWKQMHDRGEFGHICFAQGEYIHYERNWNYWVDVETGENLYAPERPIGRKVEPSWRMKVLSEPIFYLPHELSPLLYILDDRVERVSCFGTSKVSYTYPGLDFPSTEIQYALMHTVKDTVLVLGAGFSLPYPRRNPDLGCHWYELRGTRVSVESPRRWDDKFWRWRMDAGKPSATSAKTLYDKRRPEGMEKFDVMNLSSAPLGATEEQRKSGHGGTDFKPVDLFLRSILKDTKPAMDVYLAVETAAPAILAVESARQGGVMLTVPDFRPKVGASRKTPRKNKP